MKRASFFIDGFNLYHAIHNLNKLRDKPATYGTEFNYLKWNCLPTMCDKLIDKRTEQLTDVYYFSSKATHRGLDSLNRHEAYIKAQQHHGVKVILGNFKSKLATVRTADGKLVHGTAMEEKETDVNLALHILQQAFLGTYDVAYIITTDTDILPALKMTKEHNPKLKLVTVSTPDRKCPNNFIQICDDKKKITKLLLESSRLPRVLLDKSGKPYITCPKEYNLPLVAKPRMVI